MVCPLSKSTREKKLLAVVFCALVLTTNLGSNFNLNAPGAFSLLNPWALSSNDVSIELLTTLSTTSKPTDNS